MCQRRQNCRQNDGDDQTSISHSLFLIVMNFRFCLTEKSFGFKCFLIFVHYFWQKKTLSSPNNVKKTLSFFVFPTMQRDAFGRNLPVNFPAVSFHYPEQPTAFRGIRRQIFN